MITIDDFAKVELKLATILSAEAVPDTDKLLKLEVDLGTEKRQIIAGLAVSYSDPSQLVGTQVVVVANLESRTLRGLESQGMVLAVSGEDGPVLLHPEKPVEPGSTIR